MLIFVNNFSRETIVACIFGNLLARFQWMLKILQQLYRMRFRCISHEFNMTMISKDNVIKTQRQVPWNAKTNISKHKRNIVSHMRIHRHTSASAILKISKVNMAVKNWSAMYQSTVEEPIRHSWQPRLPRSRIYERFSVEFPWPCCYRLTTNESWFLTKTRLKSVFLNSFHKQLLIRAQ